MSVRTLQDEDDRKAQRQVSLSRWNVGPFVEIYLTKDNDNCFLSELKSEFRSLIELHV